MQCDCGLPEVAVSAALVPLRGRSLALSLGTENGAS